MSEMSEAKVSELKQELIKESIIPKKTTIQNPLYQTSNAHYGAKKVTEISKIREWHGRQGEFTKAFMGAMFENNSLNCNKSRSKVTHDPSFGVNAHFVESI